MAFDLLFLHKNTHINMYIYTYYVSQAQDNFIELSEGQNISKLEPRSTAPTILVNNSK